MSAVDEQSAAVALLDINLTGNLYRTLMINFQSIIYIPPPLPFLFKKVFRYIGMLINASVQDVSERNTQILCLELEGKTRFRRYTKQSRKLQNVRKL